MRPQTQKTVVFRQAPPPIFFKHEMRAFLLQSRFMPRIARAVAEKILTAPQ